MNIMVNYFKKALAGLILLLCFSNANAKILLVSDIGNAGPNTLRGQIGVAASGDTILMNVKGTISLTSTIGITNKAITILGAFPVHSIIDGSGLGSNASAFDINGTPSLLTIQGFRITNCSQGQAILIQGNSQVKIIDCLFESNFGPSNGQCIASFISAGLIEIYNCSFINNSSTNGGAAIYTGIVGSHKIRNCTFYQNSTSFGNGGAIISDGTTSIGNCTFLNNTAAGTGGSIHIGSGTVEIFNNIFSSTNATNELSGSSWNNLGGNVFSGSGIGQYAGGTLSPGPNDFAVGGQGNIGLGATPVLITDGYGLKYFRIVAQTSQIVDNGVFPAGGLLLTDCKRAPRILYGDSGLLPDAGAVEFTPFTVITNNSAGFFTSWSNMNTSGNPGPKYMDFNISGGPFTFNLSSPLDNLSSISGTDWIVDGFTQQGSVIPGPGNVPNTVTPANYFININSNANPDLMFLGSSGTNSFIAGLSLNNSSAFTNAITIDDGTLHFYGNNINSTGSVGQIGINAVGASSLIIGGQRHHNRNVIANEQFGLYLQNSYNLVQGNFIGTNNIGTASQPNDVGIVASGTTLEMKGKYRFPSMNLVSGNLNQQISIENMTYFQINGNIIGPDYTGGNVMTTTASGIDIFSNTDGIIGTGLPGDFNVIGGNSGGITIDGANAVTILGNYIGIAPMPGFPSIPNVNGITLISNGDGSHNIGDGSFGGRNYISGNSNLGIYADNSSGHTINGNFIGLNPDNNPAGNGSHGIWISNLSDNFNVMSNVIGNNPSAGIYIENAGNNSLIQDNKIGTDSTGTVSRGNLNGIDINSMNGPVTINGNLISGNGSIGVQAINSAAFLSISSNMIGLDITGTSLLGNNTGINLSNLNGSQINSNTVAGNSQDGIVLWDLSNFNIVGNRIGTNTSLASGLGNGLIGVFVNGNSNSGMIGGNSPGQENVIAFNGSAGVLLLNNTQRIGVLYNSIHDNAGLGIALTGSISTPLANDSGDLDAYGTNGNKGQNFPDNLSVTTCSGNCTLTGTLETNIAGDYRFQVFRINPGVVDGSGHGEGNELVYDIAFALPAGGSPINLTLPPTVLLNDILSVTASYFDGVNYETSEFSDTVKVRGGFTATATVVNNVSCSGGTDGTITVTHGGTSPFTYNWINVTTSTSTGITTQNAAVPAGVYTCMVTDAGCTIYSDTIVVTEPPLINAGSVTSNVNCFGASTGSIDLSPVGGVGTYIYDWNNDGTGDFDDPEDLMNIPAGTYIVSITDANGCNFVAPAISINQPGMISASPTVVNESCAGLNDGSVTVTAAGGTGSFNYQINGGGYSPSSTFFGLAPGNYSIDVQDANACVVNLIATVNAGENVVANFNVTNTTACQNAPDFNLIGASSAPSGILNWNYSIPSGSPSFATVPNVSGVILFNVGANLVTLQVTSSNGCTDDTTITINTNPAVFVDAGPDVTLCLGDPFVQSATVSGGTGGNLFNWQLASHFVDNAIEDADVTVALENTIGYFEHILQVTDVNGCSDRDTMYLDIRSIPTVNAGLDNSVCQGSTYTLAGSGSAISYVWDNGVSDGVSFLPSVTSTYTVIGTDAVGCSNTDQVTIGVDLPVTVNAGADLHECRTTAFNTLLNGIVTNASSILWSTSGSGSWDNNGITNATYYYSGADASSASITLTLIGISGNSCPNVSDGLTVFFHNAPSAFAGSDFSVCAGSPITLTGGATDYSSVDWTNGTGLFSPDNLSLSTSYSPSAAEISAGFVNLNFTAYATNAACANATDNIMINLLTTPVANAGFDGSICSSQFYTLDGAASTGTITNYSWDEVGGANVGTTQLTNVSPATSTNYALTVSNGTCSDSDTMLLTVVTAPDPTFNYSSTSFCNDNPNETPTFVATAGGLFSLPASPISINASTGEINFSGLSPGVYSVIYSITTPCNNADTIIISVFALPTVNAGNDTSFCAGGTVVLNGTSTATNFNWSNVAGFNSNTNPSSDSPTSSITYTLTVTDANGCSNTDDKIVTVNAIPTGTISGGGTFCEGDPNASLIVTANGYSGGGDWDVQFYQNSSPAANSTPPSGTYTLLGLGNSANNGLWTADIIDNFTGCIGTASGSVNINVNPEPAMSIVSPVNACSGMAAFDMDVTFIPNITGGVWTGIGVTGANFNPFSVGVGTYDVVYTMPSGCDDTIQIIVNPAPTVSFTGVNNAYCVTDPPFTPVGNPTGGLWSIDGGTFTAMTSVDPSTLSQGTHTISYQFTDGTTGCVGTTPPQGFIISTVPLDPTAVSATTQSICAGTSLVLTVSNPNTTGTTIQWYSDAALTVNVGSTINFTTPALSTSVIYYAVAQNAGCKSNPVIFDITVSAPQVTTGPDITICPGTPAQLNVTTISGTIQWSPGISLDDSTIQNPIATPNVNTTYYVTVTSGPCSATDSVNVIIDGSNPDCGVVPSYNAFSPDGDGVNETWIIDAIFNHPDNTVTIFNRWGDKLVSFEDYDNVNIVWDGLYNGQVLPSGTYFYVIEYLDIQIQVSGWLQLTR
jgi:gliding motility-associated-like protein